MFGGPFFGGDKGGFGTMGPAGSLGTNEGRDPGGVGTRDFGGILGVDEDDGRDLDEGG